MGLLKPCLSCGELSDETRCDEHRAVRLRMPKGSATSRGYDYQWTKLSARARKLQPFCSDCGRVDDLTADHSPEAWDRKERGLIIRLKDIDVLCRPCNTKRGAARGELTGGYGARNIG